LEVVVDCSVCVTKASCGGEKAGRSPVPVDRGKGGIKLLWCTERQGRVVDFWVALSDDHDLLTEALSPEERNVGPSP
jgi:hypothetical protein